MTYSTIASLFTCNHATVIHGERSVHHALKIKDIQVLNSMSVWIDIIEKVMPNSTEVMFTAQERVLYVLESTLLNNSSKITILQELLKNYTETGTV